MIDLSNISRRTYGVVVLVIAFVLSVISVYLTFKSNIESTHGLSIQAFVFTAFDVAKMALVLYLPYCLWRWWKQIPLYLIVFVLAVVSISQVGGYFYDNQMDYAESEKALSGEKSKLEKREQQARNDVKALSQYSILGVDSGVMKRKAKMMFKASKYVIDGDCFSSPRVYKTDRLGLEYKTFGDLACAGSKEIVQAESQNKAYSAGYAQYQAATLRLDEAEQAVDSFDSKSSNGQYVFATYQLIANFTGVSVEEVITKYNAVIPALIEFFSIAFAFIGGLILNEALGKSKPKLQEPKKSRLVKQLERKLKENEDIAKTFDRSKITVSELKEYGKEVAKKTVEAVNNGDKNAQRNVLVLGEAK